MNNLKLFLRSLGRNRVHSVITIVGFAVSMAVVLLLMAYIKSERSYNQQFPNIDRMFLLVREDNSASVPENIYDDLSNNFPEIEQVALWNRFRMLFGRDDSKLWGQMLFADEHFLNVFSVKVVRGSAKGLNSNDNVLLTEDFARQLFGEEDPLGKTIEFSGKRTVVGIVETPSPNSGILYDALMNRAVKVSVMRNCDETGCYDMFRGIVLLKPGVNPDQVSSKISGTIGKISPFKSRTLGVRPFKESYFDTSVSEDQILHANVSLIRLLFFVTLILAILAILNYINLSTARLMLRFREVGIKKAIGAGSGSIFRQFMGETYLICLFSILLACALAVLGKPLFESVFSKEVRLAVLISDAFTVAWLVMGFLVMGFLSGVIPALAAGRFRPVSLLSKTLPSSKGYGIRRAMNVFQLSVAIALMMALIVIMRQVHYVKNSRLGFDQDQLMRIDNGGFDMSVALVLRDKLLANPMITGVSFSQGGPGKIDGWSTGKTPDGLEINSMATITVDTAFLSVFKIPLLQGRAFTSTDTEKGGCLVNETLYKILGEGALEGKEVFGLKVLGVVADFHFQDMHQAIGPLNLKLMGGQTFWPNLINVRIRPENISETVQFIRETYLSMKPDALFEYRFFDDWFDSMYQQEEKQAAAIRIFAVLAILISCMGLFGLAEFQARRKIKEIGIRKVNGARVGEVLLLLNKDFVWWVLVAFVIATPIAWYAMHQWLEGFAYKTPLSWWIFALAGVLALFIALLTVSWQSWKAATRNPVESLRDE